jgi:hypothetical protein
MKKKKLTTKGSNDMSCMVVWAHYYDHQLSFSQKNA